MRPSIWVQTAVIHSSAARGDLLPCQKLLANKTSCGVSTLWAPACVLICPGLIPTPWACAPRTKVINDSRSIWGWGVTHLRVLGAQIGDMWIRQTVCAALSGGAWSWADLDLMASSANLWLCDLEKDTQRLWATLPSFVTWVNYTSLEEVLGI